MNHRSEAMRGLNPAPIFVIVAFVSLLICSCPSAPDDPTFPTLEDYVGTWSFDDDDGSYSLVINTDASCALATMYTGFPTSTSSGSVYVKKDGSAEFFMESTQAYMYSNSGGAETVTINSFTLTRKSGNTGTIVGTWEYIDLYDHIAITFSSDGTISGTKDNYSFTGTWNESAIHARIVAYDMNIDLSVSPNTIHLSNTGFGMTLARH
jgi:hypothetical protein